MQHVRRILLPFVLILLLAAPCFSQAKTTLDPARFPVPDSLRPNVDFWTKVYTEYDSRHVLLHDEWHLDVIYAVIDFTQLESSEISDYRKQKLRREELTKVREKYRKILLNLAAGRDAVDHPDDQARVAKLFANHGDGTAKYKTASYRLRTQTCLSDHFEEAIGRSGRFMPHLERIFTDAGLPIELTRMPFVESMFRVNAQSSAAAVGMWQFVRPTARQFLDMELEFDERFDPLRATEAAAKMLTQNHRSLSTWPLAITAYNHGPNGMRRAVSKLGTRDLGIITQKYRSRLFGFASRNFYAEFIAAAETYANRSHYFPNAVPEPAWSWDDLATDRFVSIGRLAKAAGTDLDTLRELNPALLREVWNDHLFVPKNYTLRVPDGQGEAFRAAYAALPSAAVSNHQVGLYYKVRSGDTLSKIASRFGTSVGALQRANGLRSPHLIRHGQTLLIPPGHGGGSRSVASGSKHVVRKGESLSSIARRYGTSVQALRRANRLRGDLIRPAQVLVIP